MTTTMTASGITFNSGISQTEAVNTGAGDVGSYIVAYTATSIPTTTNRGSTDSGSNLRYDSGGGALGINNTGYSSFYMRGSLAGSLSLASYSLSGTWRVMSGIGASNTQAQLWVRIA